MSADLIQPIRYKDLKANNQAKPPTIDDQKLLSIKKYTAAKIIEPISAADIAVTKPPRLINILAEK